MQGHTKWLHVGYLLRPRSELTSDPRRRGPVAGSTRVAASFAAAPSPRVVKVEGSFANPLFLDHALDLLATNSVPFCLSACLPGQGELGKPFVRDLVASVGIKGVLLTAPPCDHADLPAHDCFLPHVGAPFIRHHLHEYLAVFLERHVAATIAHELRTSTGRPTLCVEISQRPERARGRTRNGACPDQRLLQLVSAVEPPLPWIPALHRHLVFDEGTEVCLLQEEAHVPLGAHAGVELAIRRQNTQTPPNLIQVFPARRLCRLLRSRVPISSLVCARERLANRDRSPHPRGGIHLEMLVHLVATLRQRRDLSVDPHRARHDILRIGAHRGGGHSRKANEEEEVTHLNFTLMNAGRNFKQRQTCLL